MVKNVRVTIRAEVDPPGDALCEATTCVTRNVALTETDARLLVLALERAITEAGADVQAMVAQVHPDRRDEADAATHDRSYLSTATSGAGNPALGEWYPGVEQDLP